MIAAPDIANMTHVDAAIAGQRRRAMIWTVGKSTFWGGLGLGALAFGALFGASFLLEPKIIKVPELIEVPTVYETTKLIEVPKIVEVPKMVAGGKLFDPPKPQPPTPPPAKVADAPPQDGFIAQCERLGYTAQECIARYVSGGQGTATLPPSKLVEKPWNELTDKHYEGIITSVTDDDVCFDSGVCTQAGVVDANGKAVLDASGHTIIDKTASSLPMRPWIGYSVYSAKDPKDPEHLTNYWIADNGTLIKFHAAPRTAANRIDSVTLSTDDGGASLHLDVGLGASTYSFLLDTGATDLTVTEKVAAQLVADGHAAYGHEETVTLADGTSHVEPTLMVDTATVGTHQVSNVHVLVVPNSAPMLLGMDVLNQIGRFSVDVPHLQLTFG
jgi:clan AA aspartic protease (TIGR02281 family)